MPQGEQARSLIHRAAGVEQDRRTVRDLAHGRLRDAVLGRDILYAPRGQRRLCDPLQDQRSAPAAAADTGLLEEDQVLADRLPGDMILRGELRDLHASLRHQKLRHTP